MQWPKVKVIQRNTDNTMAKGKSNSKKYRQCNGQKKKYFKEIQTIQWPKEKVIQRNTDNTMAKSKVIQRNTDNTMAKSKSNSKKYRQYNVQKKK
jgi:hypothetical protein